MCQNGLGREGLKNNWGLEGWILAKANLLSKNEARAQICLANPYIRKFTFSDLRCPGGPGGGIKKTRRGGIKKYLELGGADFRKNKFT